MAQVEFENVCKRFPGKKEPVIKDFQLTIKDGEFLVLVGPSGCGKSTILRMLAGLEEISSGTLRINKEEVNHKSPQQRDIAMVFQNYALYPHLTVQQNIEVPLRIRKKPIGEIQDRVFDVANILDLQDLLKRKPKDLSGGQQQRVAMARALVRDPQVLLMDEPLSNLDAKTRVSVRTKVAEIQRKKSLTTVYVTHDQVEAMTLGDRVVVLRGGEAQQIDTPKRLYTHPENVFVANFIGSPSMNIFYTTLNQTDENLLHICLDQQPLSLDAKAIAKYENLSAFTGQEMLAGLRPEAFSLNSEDSNHHLEITVTMVEDLGYEKIVYFQPPEGKKYLLKATEEEKKAKHQEDSEQNPYFAARLLSNFPIHSQDKLTLAVDMSQVYLFNLQEESIPYQ